MIVERYSWKVKPFCMDKIVELVKAEVATWDKPPKWRVYTSNIGRENTIAMEFEFENLAEMEKYWAAWVAKPETAEYDKKWNELVETGIGNEIWNLV